MYSNHHGINDQLLPGCVLRVEHGEERLQCELDLPLVGGAPRLEEDVLAAHLGQVEAQRGQQLVAAGDVPQTHVDRHQGRGGALGWVSG